MWLNSIYQALDPVAFSFGPLVVRWYGIAYLLGFICTGLIMWQTIKRWKLKISSDDLLMIILSCAIGLLIGARIFYVVFYGAGYYLEHPLEIFLLNKGGMSFHGGFIGALVGGYLGARYLKLSFVTLADLAAIGAPTGLFFGRIANFINGELWGKATDASWGVAFESGGGIFRHPSQLYEAGLEGFVIFLVLFLLSRKLPPKPQGFFIGCFLVLYGVFRFLIEFVRVPDAQLGYLFGFVTMGQLLSLPLIFAGIIILIISFKRQVPQRDYLTSGSK